MRPVPVTVTAVADVATRATLGRYLALLVLGCLALPAAWAAVVLCSATWPELQALDSLFPYFNWHIRAISPATWQLAQRVALALAAALGSAWVGLGLLRPAGRRELAALAHGLAALGRALAGRWRTLPRGQQWFFLGHLAVLTLVRTYLSLHLHWADDAVSYEFFVRQRLLAPAAYYPLPNNHVLSNVLDWGFYQLHPGFWWSMRLPVLLTSTGGTVLLWAGLLRRLGYWPALLAAGLMSWSELSLFHAGAGRGYWLVATAAGVAFLAVLALREPTSASQATTPRVAWLALVGAGLVGTYAVPVFVYALASAFTWLGWRAGRARAWRRLTQLLGVGGALAGGILLLYGPLLLVSGAGAIAGNSYVRQLGAIEFARQLPRFAWLTEGQLLGQRHVGAVGALLVLGLFGQLLWQLRRGQLTGSLAQAVREVGVPALWFVGLPYAVLLVQHVLPPERTWLYKSWFMFVLAALVLASWQWQRPWRRGLLATGLLLYVGYQVGNQLRLNHYAWRDREGHRAIEAWLAGHPQANPALMPNLYLWGWFRFNAHIEHPERPFTAVLHYQPGQPYGSVVTGAGEPLPPGTGPLWYSVGNLRVWHVAPH